MATNTAGVKVEPWQDAPIVTVGTGTGTGNTFDLGATPPPDIALLPIFSGTVSGSPTVEIYAYWRESLETATPPAPQANERFKHLIAAARPTSANDHCNVYVVPVNSRYLRLIARRSSTSGNAGTLTAKYQRRFPAQLS